MSHLKIFYEYQIVINMFLLIYFLFFYIIHDSLLIYFHPHPILLVTHLTLNTIEILIEPSLWKISYHILFELISSWIGLSLLSHSSLSIAMFFLFHLCSYHSLYHPSPYPRSPRNTQSTTFIHTPILASFISELHSQKHSLPSYQ
jgi:hypothetical protein